MPSSLTIRNIVFGVEDSLVSTLGFLAGISIGGFDQRSIVLSGLILIVVEAFSMGAGSFLSEESTEEFEQKKTVSPLRSLHAGLTMFVSYLIAGSIPLGPYLLLPIQTAFSTSIICSLAALFTLGFFSGKEARVNPVTTGLRVLLVGGAAMAIGVAIGAWVKI
ncbi:VIT1/CCC1 transporter family protein [Candidatus Uhrbacteria bacterium]|nr:VIT1/CCC1 transporter family protein [Candidatus Uhrbacteria bacterium]